MLLKGKDTGLKDLTWEIKVSDQNKEGIPSMRFQNALKLREYQLSMQKDYSRNDGLIYSVI